MSKAKQSTPARSPNEVRDIMLRYFHARNQNATSMMGKNGSAVKISTVKKELKEQHGPTQQEVQSNLSYLLSQGWAEEKEVQKQIRAAGGTLIPSTTKFYQITAAGIDKIEGPGEFTMPRFQGIKIEATGQNIIALGDGNQINARFSDLGNALVELREAITKSDAPEVEKVTLVANIDTIQSQLATPKPSKGILQAAWDTIRAATTLNGCTSLVRNVGRLIADTLA